MKMLLLMVAALPSLSAAQTLEPVEKTFTVSAVPTVHVRNEDGRTEVSARPGDRITVGAVKEVVHASSAEEAQRLAKDVQVEIVQVGDRIEVETHYPEHNWTLWREAYVLVHVTVEAPPKSNLDVSSEDGPLTVEGFDGNLRLVTEDGDLEATDCSGVVDVSSEDGDVTLEGARGEVRGHVEDGELRIRGVLGRLSAEAEDGDIDVRLGTGSSMTGDWTVRTEDGDIRLEVPGEFAANVDARASDGSIEVDAPVTVEGTLSEDRLVGSMNGGGHRLTIRTRDGSARILTSS
jgi:DUF4097 and DUF4098 domain-containing protein YvlB